MRRPCGNSASTTERTRSSTSWMFTSPTMCGCRWGSSRRSTSVCSRSDSLMMTWVYSRSARSGSSNSSNCAAPRMPPSGFLISCARLRISSLLAEVRSSRRSSRSLRIFCSLGSSSSRAQPGSKSMVPTTACTCSASWPGRSSVRSRRLASNRRLATVPIISISSTGSANSSCSDVPTSWRRDTASVASAAGLA